MSKWHNLKTWPEPFAAMFAGNKTHEIRKDDRGFALGDFLILREFDPEGNSFTGRQLVRSIDYISRGPHWGLPLGLCVMSVKPI